MKVDLDTTVEVREGGVIILPSELREKYGIQVDDTFRLVDLGGVFVLTPMVLMVPELACQIEQLREEAALDIDELLQALREERERNS